MGLGQLNPKTDFYNQMRSYIRLQTSLKHGDFGSNVSVSCVKSDVEHALRLIGDPLAAIQEVIENIKTVALAYEACTKAKTKILKNIHKGSHQKTRVILKVLRDTEKLVDLQQQLVDYYLNGKNNFKPDIQNALGHVCEYLSFLVVGFFATVEEAIGRAFEADLEEKLKLRIKKIARTELLIRKKLGIEMSATGSEQLENQFYKVRLLKKYFQKSLFVNVEAERLAPKVLQPVAGLAAGVAAVWAGFFQIAQTDRSFALSTGLTPVGILSLGVMAYVIKDRIKETLRARLAGKVENVLPDVERKLFYKAPDAKPKPLGLIRESIRRLRFEEIPGDIKEIRYTGEYSGLEQELGEDIIHYRKKIRLLKSSTLINKEQVGIREILRLNLSPFLHKLDDPFKEISFVDESGQISRSEVHRLYYAHLAIKVSTPEKRTGVSKTYLTRLALDRKGIVRLTTPTLI